MGGIEWDSFGYAGSFCPVREPARFHSPASRRVVVLKSLQKDTHMSPNNYPFDAQFPYKLSDDDYNRLIQVHGLLTVLTDLTGDAKPDRHLDCKDLHHALWAIQDSLDTVVMHLEQRDREALARVQAANQSNLHPTNQQA
jgi:hypothetical protein